MKQSKLKNITNKIKNPKVISNLEKLGDVAVKFKRKSVH